jgi:hypothetical protein
MNESNKLHLLAQLAVSAGLALAATGCSSLSAPFDQMKGSQMTLYRLQNFSPPAAQAATPAMGGFALPPQIQQWISAGASLLPPGLLPPGLLPGSAAPPPAAANTQRFPPEMGAQGFPIIAWQPITDTSVSGQVIDTLGHQSNFMQPPSNCMYAELGISIAQPNNPTPANILVSLSCQQVQAFNIQWPYPQTGLTPDAEKKFVTIAQQVFAGH